MKQLFFRGKIIPLACLPPGTKVSKVRITTFRSKRVVSTQSHQIITTNENVKVKVFLNITELPLERVLSHIK